MIIFAWVILSFVLILATNIVATFMNVWFDKLGSFIFNFLDIIKSLTFILPALAIKDKKLRLIGIIIMSIMALYFVIVAIVRMYTVFSH